MLAGMSFDIRHGDCREVMARLDAESVDAIVCDPPYGLSFMGKGWDSFKEGDIAMRRNPQMDAVNTGASRQGGRQRACVDYQKRQARDMMAFQEAMNAVFIEALRVAKPGAHLLAFGGTRTYHRLACAIEDAGWEIRDCVMWVYGSGFPKSHDVSKAIDKAAGHWRGKSAGITSKNGAMSGPNYARTLKGDPVTAAAAAAAAGWGTALKPAWEPVIVARKPLCGTVAENVLRHGTGGINVDGCRVEGSWTTWRRADGSINAEVAGFASGHIYGDGNSHRNPEHPSGRWPANVIHDGSDEVVGLFPSVKSGGQNATASSRPGFSGGWSRPGCSGYHDSGSAARFFYCAKASKADREEGLADMPQRDTSLKYNGGEGFAGRTLVDGEWVNTDKANREKPRNHHPTVKPTALMRYLCRLVTPPGGLVLDPFCGSGSTGKAAVLEGFRFIGIEREAEYVEIARSRIAAVISEPSLFE